MDELVELVEVETVVEVELLVLEVEVVVPPPSSYRTIKPTA